MRFRAREHVLLVVIEADSKIRRVVCFEALAEVATERQISLRIVCGERDIFQPVKRFPRHTRIGEHRPILLPAVEHDRGPRRCGGTLVILCLNGTEETDGDGCNVMHSPAMTWKSTRRT